MYIALRTGPASVATLPLGARVNRAFRDGSADARRVYVAVRKARALFRDRRRRTIVRTLPATAHRIPEPAGFLVVPAGALDGVSEVVEHALRALAAHDRDRPPAGKNKKRFLVNVLHQESVTLESPLLAFALRDDIIAVVARYLGVVPLLTAVKVFHSDAVEGVPTSSQLYHCDGDDLRQVKIFVYCSDVDARSGPLTVLDAAASAAVQERTRYTYDRRLADEDVRAARGGAVEHPIVGPAGTVAFVDTSRCLHFGSRVSAGAPPRLVTMVQYSTPYSFMLPYDFRGAAPFRRLIAPSLSPLQRLVLGE